MENRYTLTIYKLYETNNLTLYLESRKSSDTQKKKKNCLRTYIGEIEIWHGLNIRTRTPSDYLSKGAARTAQNHYNVQHHHDVCTLTI